jgi:hypothetical protein
VICLVSASVTACISSHLFVVIPVCPVVPAVAYKEGLHLDLSSV